MAGCCPADFNFIDWIIDYLSLPVQDITDEIMYIQYLTNVWISWYDIFFYKIHAKLPEWAGKFISLAYCNTFYINNSHFPCI